MRKFVLLLIAFLFSVFSVKAADDVLKVLAIGNSFSVDAVEQNLYELAAAQGKKLLIGNAYIGGCSIDSHWEFIQSNAEKYAYRKIVDGKKTNKPKQNLTDIIKDEDWDIITLQQASHFSGQYGTYSNLKNLKERVKSLATNPKVRFAFHMTWAYQQNSTHDGFKNYDNNQTVMYRSICKAVNHAMHEVGIIDVIPSGRAIQIAREMVGDTLTRDGYHLSYVMGRYIAACTWCEFLTGKSVVGNGYRPAGLSAEAAKNAQQAADKAFRHVKKALRKGETL